ncbi:SidA/IucD/PvdA family monooxygenase [Zooshikella marina]|nr:SidA/IucD/PvdA family monooxygenase [Zooshikella ganghwensis]MBU2707555.1 SidA/IucD/PvdA family monooxygenase [Zooshikella ganghwensis]
MGYEYDSLGVGAGISNLSLAKLLSENKDITGHFLNTNANFEWYSGHYA